MSETTELIFDGTFCCVCGVLIDVPENDGDEIASGPGYQRECANCADEDD